MTVTAMQHAPVAKAKAAFPLVIFSHGIGGNRLAYSAIICSLVCQVTCLHVLTICAGYALSACLNTCADT